MQVVLTVKEGPHQGKAFSFEKHDTFIVGRADYAHFRLSKDDRYFSRAHFMVEVNPPLCRLLDMDSRNGTFVNKRQVSEVDLNDGDLIQGGKTVIHVAIHGDGDESNVKHPSSAPSSDDDAATQVYDGAQTKPDAAEASSPTSLPASAPPSTPADRNLEPTMQLIGATGRIGDYRLIKELGRGGMGVVYQAVRETDGQVVAIKTIRPQGYASSRDMERFLREARILCELNHPNIVKFFELREENGQLCFAMEYVPGVDSARLLASTGPLPVSRATRIVCQLLEALQYAHDRQFVHRDIKPGNLLLMSSDDGQDRVKLADFGLARVYQSSKLSGLTLQGETGGSFAYIAPEQITNYRESKPATDLYATAATLYNLLTGEYVFDLPKKMSERVLMILQETPVLITNRRGDLPPALAAAIHQGLSRNPQDRQPSAAAMREALLPFTI